MKFKIIILGVVIIIVSFTLYNYLIQNKDYSKINNRNIITKLFKEIEVEKILINSDKDNDGIHDLQDIVDGARNDAGNKPKYTDKYYSGGYPPDNEGVCTDVVWRSLKNAGYNLKDLIDIDIKSNISDYPRISGEAIDSNIDFRRVPNLISFFRKYGDVLTTEIIPGDKENLREWQGGDIVAFDKPYEHIAIVSDKRNKDGVPYIIHNSGPYSREEDALLYWHENVSKITWHFRYPKID